MSADDVAPKAFETLFDVLNDNVQEVQLSDGSTATLQRDGGGDDLYWMAAFPTRVLWPHVEDTTSKFEYDDMMQRDAYPFGVVPNPNIDSNQKGYRVFDDRVEINVAVVAVKAEATSRFEAKVRSAVRTNYDTFESNGFLDADVVSSDYSMTHTGDMKVHVKTLVVELMHPTEVVE